MNERTLTCSTAAAVAAACVWLGAAGCSAASADAKSPAQSSSDADGSTVAPADAVTASADAADDDADAGSSCQTGGLPTDTYAPNLKKIGRPASGDPQGDAGSSGALTFVLESDEVADAASGPLEPYTNSFTLQLLDSTGQPVKDATVTLPIERPSPRVALLEESLDAAPPARIVDHFHGDQQRGRDLRHLDVLLHARPLADLPRGADGLGD